MLYLPDEIDLDQYYANAQKQDVTITEPIKDEYWGDRVFTIRDPDGFVLSFCKTVKQMSVKEVAAFMNGSNPSN